MKIEKFEDILSWQKAKELISVIYPSLVRAKSSHQLGVFWI